MTDVTILQVGSPQITIAQPGTGQLEISSSPGPQGPAGPTGATGAVGATGPQGLPGDMGSAGWSFAYNFTNVPGVPTSQGKVAGNALPAPFTTLIYLAYEPTGPYSGVTSIAPLLRNARTGTRIILQDRQDETKYAVWIMTANAIDIPASRYVSLPVSFVSQSATGIDGQAVMMFALAP